jgi:hypothetical protein
VYVLQQNVGVTTWASSTCGNMAVCQTASAQDADQLTFYGVANVPVYITAESTSGQPFPFSLTVTPGPTSPFGDMCPGSSLATTLAGAISDLTPSGALCGGTHRANPEVVYAYTATVTGNYVVRETSATRVALWASNGTCGGSSCSAYSETAESLYLPMVAGQTTYIVVEDLATLGSSGAFTLSVVKVP